MPTTVEVTGLNETIEKMQRYPAELHRAQALTTSASLIVLWENVPPYPQQPEGSVYDRTGALGRTLGSGETGGVLGEPDIYTVKPLGTMGYEGRFGTRLSYAQYVIGDLQARWMSHWWKLKTVAEKSTTKILSLFNTMAEKMVRFLESR